MQLKNKANISLIIIHLLLSFSGFTQNTINKQNIEQALFTFCIGPDYKALTGHHIKDTIEISRIEVSETDKIIKIYFNISITTSPIRNELIKELEKEVINSCNGNIDTYEVKFYAVNKKLEAFIPNFCRTDILDHDFNRRHEKLERTAPPLVQNISNPVLNNSTLSNINIALWNSHGWYYEHSLHRWEWQRARLFNTVEDLYPTSYVLHFLIPMLENSGVNVFLPRDRYWQKHEIIIDNDSSTHKSTYKNHNKYKELPTGYKHIDIIAGNENPFTHGTSIEFEEVKKNKTYAEWIPNIPEDGEYPVYISFSENNKKRAQAKYIVYHTGGRSEFLVNQNIGAGTWVYLGNFVFKKGINNAIGKIELKTTKNNKKETLTADAVRLGNGIGIIKRNGLTSKRPKYQEASRYYLQYAGFPDSIVWNQNDNNDYTDDRHARTAWVNYLIGAPSGPKKNRNVKGLGIPVDLTLAFHTDAGITNSDSVIGTLGIYSTKVDTNVFPNGKSKIASRDLTDLIQSQIVNDLKLKYDSNWVRRDMWDKAYTEAARPNTPTMMLELLSHQNFIDVRFGKEPTFQFDVCRSIYKGILKFLNAYYGLPYIVQPLPVTHFSTQVNKNEITLSWKEQIDSLESTAKTDAYVVYKRLNDNGYDNGTLVKGTTFTLKHIEKNTIYSFKVSAVNKGGESFPSEELSVGIASKPKGEVLILNAFDRIGGPAWFNDELNAGFLAEQDAGIPYKYDIHTTGNQYDFIKSSPWLDDDSPGFGASYADLEDKVIPGNTFNFSFIHGQSILNAGYSFVSVSDEAVESDLVDLKKYKLLDFLAGEEKTSYLPKSKTVNYKIFTDAMLEILESYTSNGGNIFISGAHIATDAQLNKNEEKVAEILKYKWRTSNASKTGIFYSTNKKVISTNKEYSFNAGYHPKIYSVEGADAIEPVHKQAKTFLRYYENNMSAGTVFKGKYNVVALGFPFETIIDKNERDYFMLQILNILENNE